jgi:hypothetical protein
MRSISARPCNCGAMITSRSSIADRTKHAPATPTSGLKFIEHASRTVAVGTPSSVRSMLAAPATPTTASARLGASAERCSSVTAKPCERAISA